MTDSIKYEFLNDAYWYIPDEDGGFHRDWLTPPAKQLHRYDGPAAEIDVDHEGAETYLWFILGNMINGEEYKAWLIESNMDINNLTDHDKILIDLKWGLDG